MLTFDSLFQIKDRAAVGQSDRYRCSPFFRVNIDVDYLNGDAVRSVVVDYKLLALADNFQQQIKLVGKPNSTQDFTDAVVRSIIPAALDTVVEFIVFD